MGSKGRPAQTTVVYFFVLFITVHCNNLTSDIIEDLLSEKNYSSRVRPQADSGRPLDVYINMNINDISSISETKMEYSMTLYLRQMWKDERLVYANYDRNITLGRNITLNHKEFDRVWSPDVFIRNLKSGVLHTITVPNRLVRLSPDGTVLYSQRLTVTLTCDMILDKFPFDNQKCKIELGSYSYTTEDIVFHWRSDAGVVELNDKISLPEYHIQRVSHMVCSQAFSSTGSFPCLRAYFHLERRLRAYVLSTYLPSLLVVLLSWVSFWIDLEAVPTRISLGIVTMLTITMQSFGQGRLLAVSFTTAIDVWMATCLVFVFGAFIEYSVVNVLDRRAKNKETHKTPAAAAQIIRWYEQMCYGKIQEALLVDIISRVIFPIMFLIFNMIYWPLYLL